MGNNQRFISLFTRQNTITILICSPSRYADILAASHGLLRVSCECFMSADVAFIHCAVAQIEMKYKDRSALMLLCVAGTLLPNQRYITVIQLPYGQL